MRSTKKTAAAPQVPVAHSKKDHLIELLQREGGASIADIIGGTAWLPHTARAMLTALRKKGHSIDKQKVDGVTRYAITSEQAA